MFVIDEKKQADSRSVDPSSSRTFSLTFLFRYYAPRRRALFVLLTYALRLAFSRFFFLHAMTLLLFVG
jgi:hypothetical protein